MSDSEAQEFDVVVVGAGIAGLTAATTAAGLGLSVVVLEQLGPGGQLLDTATVLDDEHAEQPAADLAAAAMESAMDAGALLEFTSASKLVTGERHLVETDSGSYSAAAVVLAMGSTPARVDVPGEAEFAGRGVSYCVACDGPIFSGQPVVMLGGGRYAAREAHELRELVSQITVVSLDEGDSGAGWLPSLEVGGNLDLIRGAKVLAIEGGEGKVSGVRLVQGDNELQLDALGVFVCAGRTPATHLALGLVDLDLNGRIVVDDSLNTGTPGLYAVGDIRADSAECLSSATQDGRVAANAIAVHCNRA